MEFLEEILKIDSTSGFEKNLSTYLGNQLYSMNVNFEQDRMGNIIVGNKKADVLIVAHMDEVGLIVTGVGPRGLILARPIGGVDLKNYYGKILNISCSGRDFAGVVSCIDEKEKILFIDMGAETSTQFNAIVNVGEPLLCDNRIQYGFNDTLISKGLDNKVGVSILFEMIKLNDRDDIAFAFTVGEENTKIGASALVHEMNPKRCIVIDATPTNEFGDARQICNIALGMGPVINVSGCMDQQFTEQIVKISNECNINIQKECVTGVTHTDADVFLKAGIPSAVLSYPIRRMHAFGEMCSKKDIEACKQMLFLYIQGKEQ